MTGTFRSLPHAPGRDICCSKGKSRDNLTADFANFRRLPMITLLSNLPDNIIGLNATGRVTGDDYLQVLVPAVEVALERHDKVRLIYELDDAFTGFVPDAMWEDAKLGLGHLGAWGKLRWLPMLAETQMRPMFSSSSSLARSGYFPWLTGNSPSSGSPIKPLGLAPVSPIEAVAAGVSREIQPGR